MSNLHVCTTDDLMADAIEGTGKCVICGHFGRMWWGWLDAKCGSCGNVITDDPRRTCRLRREWLGLTIEQAADRLGIKRATVKQYETKWPSRRYWEWLQKASA